MAQTPTKVNIDLLLQCSGCDKVFSRMFMPSRRITAKNEPTLEPDRALRALAEQIERLQKLKNRNCDEADAEETEWESLTQVVLEAAFGDPSSSLSKFYLARAAGQHSLTGIGPRQRQINFEARLTAQEALLRSLVEALRLQLPEEGIKGVYAAREDYAFYRDLSSLFESAARDIFIVDAYLDEQVFNLYVNKVPISATVRVLSNSISANVIAVAKMYANKRTLQMRSSADAHDRAVFIDQRGWVIGQSIKAAARSKPTYMVELNESRLIFARDVHNTMWAAATAVI